jgi:undecaprenyl pyrophosphate phosphatase UppP|tara:strand:+ start:600 stop:980 length:381 start_codon:yes stop_codon:yes gene_type:complete
MDMYDNIIVRLCVFSTVYIVVLIFMAPFIDHLFTSLEDDKDKQETNIQILIEIILHTIVLAVSWFFLHKYLRQYLEKIMNIKMKEATKTAIDIVSAVALVGLQRNLIQKLKYISYEHPFRLTDLYK